MTCETVRDLLPELTAGALEPAVAGAVERHVGACGPCASEYEIVALVRTAAVPAPAGLEARVRRAVRSPARQRLQLPVRQLAVAATTAFAVLTGGLLLREAASRQVANEAAAADVSLGWPVVQDPILRATPALHELSVEELESLLEELES